LRLAAIGFVRIGLGGSADSTARTAALATSAAVIAVTAVVVASASTALGVHLAVLLCVLVPFLHAANGLLKGRFPKLVGFERLVFVVFLETGLDIRPGIGDSYRWFETLDPRPQSVHCATLVAIGGIFLILVASDCLVLNALEQKVESVRINLRGAAVGRDNGIELVKGSFGRNFESFVLCEVSRFA
jgi:hypothetical protein